MSVVLILADGMRPDSFVDIPIAQELIGKSAASMNAKTVMPSVTLPCHMSLFHSVDPERHGTTTNTYAPQVRPVKGLCETLTENGKKCAFFYSWAELRDLTRPSSLIFSYFCKGKAIGYEQANDVVSDAAIKHLAGSNLDFLFVYLGYPDEAGHKYGWMSKEYLHAVKNSWENIAKIVHALSEDDTVIITADHGGHDRIHGTELPEDMTIPLIIMGKDFVPGTTIQNAKITDIAPTAAKLLGVVPDREWEGKSLI